MMRFLYGATTKPVSGSTAGILLWSRPGYCRELQGDFSATKGSVTAETEAKPPLVHFSFVAHYLRVQSAPFRS